MVSNQFKNRYFPLILFMSALFLRMVHQVFLISDPLSMVLFVDQASYHEKALDIVNGKLIPDTVFYQAPIYPYFVAGIYAIFGRGNLVAVRIIQALLGSMIPVLIYFLCRKIFSWNESMIAGLLLAPYGVLIFYEGLILKVTLSLFITCLFILVTIIEETMPFRRTFGSGLLFGISCLLRGNMLIFFPFVILYYFLQLGRKRGMKHVPVFITGVMICILPVTAINYYRAHDFVLLTAHGGQNLYVGFNPYADGKAGRPPYFRANPEYEEHDARSYAERETGRKMKPSEISRFWQRKALQYIKTHPARSLQLLWLKFRLFFNGYEIPDNKNFYFDRRFSPVLYVCFANYGMVTTLGLVGFFLTFQFRRRTFLLHSFLVVYSISIIIFHVYSRYRIPVLVSMVPFAAYTLTWFYGKLREKNLKQFFTGMIVIILVAMFVNKDLGKYNFAQWHYNVGKGYLAQGQVQKAREEFRRALQISPSYSPALNNMGQLYYGEGNMDKAMEYFRKAFTSNPNMYEAYLNLGTCFAEKGDLEKAETFFNKSISLNPEYERGYFNLGRLYMLKKDYEKAILMFEKARNLNPGNNKTLFNLAEAWEQVNPRQAIDLWRTLLRSLPSGASFLPARTRIAERIKRLETTSGLKYP